jgi:hypothetical protein
MLPITGVNNLADPRVRITRDENNRSAIVARNVEISAARSTAPAYLASEDVWYSSKFDEQLTFLNDGNLHDVTAALDLRDRTNSKTLGLILQILQHAPSSSRESRARL